MDTTSWVDTSPKVPLDTQPTLMTAVDMTMEVTDTITTNKFLMPQLRTNMRQDSLKGQNMQAQPMGHFGATKEIFLKMHTIGLKINKFWSLVAV